MDAPLPASAQAPSGESASMFRPRLKQRRRQGRWFEWTCLALTLVAVLILALLLAAIFSQGWRLLSWKFLNTFPKFTDPLAGGIKGPLWGTVWLMVLTGVIAVPVGVGAAVYLQEYARKTRFNQFIALNIANLAGVPAIVYGILGLAVFVRWMALDRSVISGALTMSLVILPVIIISAREAIAAVPDSIRQAAYALGATRWQTIRHHVLPAALPGIMTGIILALSRAIGESAPLILIGAVVFANWVPGGSLVEDYPHSFGGLLQWLDAALHDKFTVLPLQIFDWARRPQPEFHRLAAAGIIVLLAVLLTMNAVAVAIRAWQQRGRL